MRRFTTILALATVLLLPAVAMADAAQLVGKWSVTTMIESGKSLTLPPGMSIIMEFKKDGTWTGTTTNGGKTEYDGGTWTMTGNQLTTIDKAHKSETITVTITGTNASFQHGNSTMVAKKI